jgi:hypothetical protein
MVSVMELWRPILLATFLVFVASNLLWMALPFWHAKDYGKLETEHQVLQALESAPSGQYAIPRMDWKTIKPEEKANLMRGPMGFLILRNPGEFSFGSTLVKYVLFVLFMVFFVAQLAAQSMSAGSLFFQVFRMTGATSMLAFSFGTVPESIWYGKPWPATGKQIVDGMIYGLLIGCAFGWLWPR